MHKVQFLRVIERWNLPEHCKFRFLNRADTERDVMDDDRDVESLVSGRSGASDVSGLSEVAHQEEPEGHSKRGWRVWMR